MSTFQSQFDADWSNIPKTVVIVETSRFLEKQEW